jgi:hypothetical protein
MDALKDERRADGVPLMVDEADVSQRFLWQASKMTRITSVGICAFIMNQVGRTFDGSCERDCSSEVAV